MLKRIKENSKVKKGQLYLVGFSLIFISLGLIVFQIYENKKTSFEEQELKEEFYEKYEKEESPIIEPTTQIVAEKKKKESDGKTTTINYIGMLKIPKIKLEKGFLEKDNPKNNVNKNIQILADSNYPDKDKGNVIIASHSGNSKVSFFKNLDKLELNDKASILYKGKEYKYKLVNSYDVEKTGKVAIYRNKEVNTLTLITCRKNTNKQIVLIFELEEII